MSDIKVVISGNEKATLSAEVKSGGVGGTSNYLDLTNKPKINGVELAGELTTDDLGIGVDTSNLATKDDIPTKTSELENDSKFVDKALLEQSCMFLVKEIDNTKGEVQTLNEKVDNLPAGAEYTAGDGITISDNEISSSTVIRTKGVWNSTTAYKAGEVVTYNIGEANGQRKFMCLTDNTGVTPNIFSSNSYWFCLPNQDQLAITSTSDVPICCAKSNGASGSYATAWRINVPKLAIYVSNMPTINLQTGVMKCPSGIEGYYTKDEVDALVGDLGTILDEINGEII